MIRGCLMQLITWGFIVAVILWILRHPESVAGLAGAAIGLVVDGGDAIGTLVTALTAEVDGLI
ncbi:hypothetical protein Q7689_00015 [Nocardiopsis tropica]|uniref:hypothetical protein n=2 Tax=Nocardiopsis TaxID=2013 RepID=UPI002E88AE6B|nr:hypothetical protein [Nocardiopsis tropica]